ncbi:hypothetical protein PSPO01_15701 [Paraphaeosphaeria sporulosa]
MPRRVEQLPPLLRRRAFRNWITRHPTTTRLPAILMFGPGSCGRRELAPTQSTTYSPISVGP